MHTVQLDKTRFTPAGLRARMREIAGQIAAEARQPQLTDLDYMNIKLRIDAENDIQHFAMRRGLMSRHGARWNEELKPKIIVVNS